MAVLSRGQTYGVTETITNTKLHNLVDLGSVTAIMDADIDGSANISNSKLADITTGNKVSGSALYNLASTPSGAGVFPYTNIPSASLVSIPNVSLIPITLASWVSGSAIKNLNSLPSTAGLIPYYNIVTSLASGGGIIFDGVRNFVGGNTIPAYVAGSYQILGPTALAVGNQAGYTKVQEIYIARSGQLTITFGLMARDGGDGSARIYRNGSAVGTVRSKSTGDATWTDYSENISGWSVGDLLQIYAKNDGNANGIFTGAVRVYENTPYTESIATGGAWKLPMNVYAGSLASIPGGLGSDGDLFVNGTGIGGTKGVKVKAGGIW